MRLLSLFALVTLSCFCAAHAAETHAMRSVSYESAAAILTGSLKKAEKQNRNVAIVVIDAAGEVVASARMDGAKPLAMELALKKAKTAILFRGTSRSAMEEINGGATALLSLDDLAALPGGLALNVDGAFVGAVGVSGAPADIDEIIAGAGLKTVQN